MMKDSKPQCRKNSGDQKDDRYSLGRQENECSEEASKTSISCSFSHDDETFQSVSFRLFRDGVKFL